MSPDVHFSRILHLDGLTPDQQQLVHTVSLEKNLPIGTMEVCGPPSPTPLAVRVPVQELKTGTFAPVPTHLVPGVPTIPTVEEQPPEVPSSDDMVPATPTMEEPYPPVPPPSDDFLHEVPTRPTVITIPAEAIK